MSSHRCVKRRISEGVLRSDGHHTKSRVETVSAVTAHEMHHICRLPRNKRSIVHISGATLTYSELPTTLHKTRAPSPLVNCRYGRLLDNQHEHFVCNFNMQRQRTCTNSRRRKTFVGAKIKDPMGVSRIHSRRRQQLREQ